jgi:predicted LPLAT superfamily acyltransferase
VLRHFYYFAATILDRVYLLRGEFDRFCVTIHGKELLQHQDENGKGCILLGSHLGSFEVLRALGVMQRGFSLKVLMDTAHNQNISRFFDGLNPTIADTVIAPDRPDTLIRARESLDAGCFVGMLGDRVFGADKTTHCARQRHRLAVGRFAICCILSFVFGLTAVEVNDIYFRNLRR